MTVSDPNNLLRAWLNEDFADLADNLQPLCLDDTGTGPIFFSHVPLARRSARFKASDLFHDRVHRAYVYLASYYFCVDSIIDGHGRSGAYEQAPRKIASFLGTLLSTSTHLFSLAVKEQFPEREAEVLGALRALLHENAIALLEEERFSLQPLLARTNEEKENIIGRANLFIFLFNWYWTLGDIKDIPVLCEHLREFVFLMQLGDDVGDWRQDFRASRWTSFLRECFMTLDGIPSEDKLEEFIYLSGAYERRLSRVINGFSKLIEAFSRVGQKDLSSYISSQRDAALNWLQEFTRAKVEFDLTRSCAAACAVTGPS